jgi:hypothetical protein
MEANEAKLCVNFGGEYGELPDPVLYDAPEGEIRQWVTEAVRTGGIPGITQNETADFQDYVIDRTKAKEDRPYNLIQVRPKTPFGR